MNWFEYLLYGIVSGFAELLPISSSAHQKILQALFGVSSGNALHDLIVHIVVLCSILFLNRAYAASNRSRRTRADAKHLKTALIPIFVGAIFYPIVLSWNIDFSILAVLLLINGIILYIPSRMLNGNKTAASLSGFDSLLIGTGAALGVFPGISRVAGVLSAASARGADSKNAFQWSLYLSIPSVVIMIIMDIVSLGTASAYSLQFFGAVLSVAGVAIGVGIGYCVMRFLAVRAGFTLFSYYSWGAALFSFILYLLV